MKNIIFSVVVLFATYSAYAQCAYPIVDSALWQNTPDSILAITTDNNLNDIDTVNYILGQYTEFDLQFILPKIAVQNCFPPIQFIKFNNVYGLPNGMTYSLDSVGTANNNIYNPDVNRFGALKFCGNPFSVYEHTMVSVVFSGCASLSGITSCSDVAIKFYLKRINSNPYFSPTYACVGDSVSFTLNNPYNTLYQNSTFLWTFHDQTTSALPNPTKQYAQSGNYPVHLQVDTIDVWDTVQVFEQTPLPAITASNGFVLCPNESTTLNAIGNYSQYKWTKTDGTVLGYSSSISINSADTFYLEVYAPQTICPAVYGPIIISEDSANTPIILQENNFIYAENPNQYTVQWYLNDSLLPNETNDTLSTGLNSYSGSFVVSFTSINGCVAFSEPYSFCNAGIAQSTSNSLDLENNITFTTIHSTILSNKTDISWALSTQEGGPISTIEELENALENGWVFYNQGDSSITLSCADLPESANGNYYLTPYTSLPLQSSVYESNNELNTCTPEMNMCIDFEGMDYLLTTLNLITPSNDVISLTDTVYNCFGYSVSIINPPFWNFVESVMGQNYFCQDFPQLYNYQGTYNGTWQWVFENSGSTDAHFSVAPFEIIVYADSCNNLTSDQIIYMPSMEIDIPANGQATLPFTIPPNYSSTIPGIEATCLDFGSPVLFQADCNTPIKELAVLDAFNLFPNPNTGSFCIDFNLKESGNYEFSIYNTLGQTVLNQEYDLKEGFNHIDFSNLKLTNGVYSLYIKNQKETIARKFLVE
ncbi:MAG: T9SS type A sorting domain-containing protein [Chitinophagales bacterium]|nr:T9SS type A sorting domain-containing protein [Chitinophagales bacterium]